jgi:hypothetical protein
MAADLKLERSNGSVTIGEFVGKDLVFLNVSKGSAISAANLESYVQGIEQICSVLTIGSSFTVASSTSVNMVVDGLDTTGVYPLASGSTGTYLDRLSELTGVTVTAATF